jgi:hypothetical protein
MSKPYEHFHCPKCGKSLIEMGRKAWVVTHGITMYLSCGEHWWKWLERPLFGKNFIEI